MTGIEDRLRSVTGVSNLSIELGEEGIEGIRVWLQPDADESTVLDEVRRILVAYGLRSRGEGAGRRPIGTEDVVDERPARRHAPVRPSDIAVRAVPEGLEVRLEAGERRVVARADATPDGAAEAMVKAVSGWLDVPLPDRVSVGRCRVDGESVLTVLLRRAGVASVGSGLAGGSQVDGLYRAARAAVEALYR